MERRRVRYTGRVQGVGFRATARSVASGFNVCGWVRNEPDGSVVLEAQGEPGEIDAMLAALRRSMGGFIRTEVAQVVAAGPGEPGFLVSR